MFKMTRTDPEWKDKIITGDETWVYGYDPETKRQSAEWRVQDIAPNDFFLFPKLKEVLKGRHFDTREDIIEKSLLALKSIPKEAYKNCFDNWEKRWRWNGSEKSYLQSLTQVVLSVFILSLLLLWYIITTCQLTGHAMTDESFVYLYYLLVLKFVSPDVAPSDFHFFPELKKNLGGTQFQDDDEFGRSGFRLSTRPGGRVFDSGFHNVPTSSLSKFEFWSGLGTVCQPLVYPSSNFGPDWEQCVNPTSSLSKFDLWSGLGTVCQPLVYPSSNSSPDWQQCVNL
ncbi:hypothetical protein LAZ67_3006090 [Cordylochernes scorpioides]|uniref:Uncharacterized protein n=1 Tax=Cordylochernes scorpioides TaxID=51811 RepID=A0ABY6KC88_9ARAC|nr:hypothetical protein LAZ67_3006090 [Cordylochernes scorpioides]